ncbi:hypothetical protein JQ631_01765 [Bradyrhizobium manausense]|uniref:hypothetical protein n=1 Tax=Bradyrhizobium manausense TaxID=989370 RepID=UPI001BA60578|nr:hypothetical protein [Bradyrhizobium manausense]MBR0787775.1 hypothetical protein [Bradyrhizobium manausense]
MPEFQRIGYAMQNKKHRILTMLAAIVLGGLFIFHFGTFVDRAQPALIDDHDILMPLGIEGQPTAPLRDIWADLTNTDEYREIAQTGKSGRFRPAYYPLRAIETYLWGANIRLWSIARFGLYASTTVVIFSLFLRTFGLASGLVFVAFYLGHKSWADIFPRLGPVEIQCVLVGTLLVWLLWRWIEKGRSFALYFAIPTALLFGAMKEPDPLLLIASGGLLLVCGFLSETKRMVSGGAILLASGAVVFVIFLRITLGATSTGIVSPSGPWKSYLEHRGEDALSWVVLVPVLVVGLAMVARALNRFKMSWGELLALLLALLSIEVMRLALYYISFSMTFDGYNDAIGMRYGYPLALMQSLVAAVVLGRLATGGGEAFVSRTSRTVALCCFLAVLILNHGLFSPYLLRNRDWWLKFNTDTSTAITEAARLLAEARRENKNPVLIATGPSLEYEPKLSLILFLKRKMPDTVVYFDPDEKTINAEAYRAKSIEWGGTPLSPEVRASLAERGCVDVHIDDREYSNPSCKVLNILNIASRPAP